MLVAIMKTFSFLRKFISTATAARHIPAIPTHIQNLSGYFARPYVVVETPFESVEVVGIAPIKNAIIPVIMNESVSPGLKSVS